MTAPSIYVVVRCTGDGYGHGDKSCAAWFFTEAEAKAEANTRGTGNDYWHEVEEVPAGSPMPEPDRW